MLLIFPVSLFLYQLCIQIWVSYSHNFTSTFIPCSPLSSYCCCCFFFFGSFTFWSLCAKGATTVKRAGWQHLLLSHLISVFGLLFTCTRAHIYTTACAYILKNYLFIVLIYISGAHFCCDSALFHFVCHLSFKRIHINLYNISISIYIYLFILIWAEHSCCCFCYCCCLLLLYYLSALRMLVAPCNALVPALS